MTKDLTLSDFDYYLPNDLIAQQPPTQRTASRLLHLDSLGKLHDKTFKDFTRLLRPGDVLIFNNTKVINARLVGQKQTGGQVEVLIERITGTHTALAHVRSSKAPRPGTTLLLENQLTVTVEARQEALFELSFTSPVETLLEQYGKTPLPPYIQRQADSHDLQRYQTVYASQPGAVAAPTAGLHFDQAMLDQLDSMGVHRAFVTLHVGAGTFQPVREQNIRNHIMHAERFTIPPDTIQALLLAKQEQRRVIAVGTTSARTLEAAASTLKRLNPEEPISDTIADETQLFITPGYQFQWVDALLTNFHLPQSTLLMMVSALGGMDAIQKAYQHAVADRYRFFSYGDAMFIESPES